MIHLLQWPELAHLKGIYLRVVHNTSLTYIWSGGPDQTETVSERSQLTNRNYTLISLPECRASRVSTQQRLDLLMPVYQLLVVGTEFQSPWSFQEHFTQNSEFSNLMGVEQESHERSLKLLEVYSLLHIHWDTTTNYKEKGMLSFEESWRNQGSL